MRAMFGEKTFDKETIKWYTKKQFFIPSKIEDWQVQLASTIKCIELITCEDGIASEAYRTALDLYEQNEPTFRATFQTDKLMGVKILHFLDRVFQEFVSDLSRFYEDENSDPTADLCQAHGHGKVSKIKLPQHACQAVRIGGSETGRHLKYTHENLPSVAE
jgi:hypothetical protein